MSPQPRPQSRTIYRGIGLGFILILATLGLGLHSHRSQSSSPHLSSNPTLAPIDVTFLVASDTHLGLDPATDRRNEQMLSRMNGLENTQLPNGGTLPKPQGLFITGDLTEDGGAEQWKLFERTYLDRAAMPIFENFGNHDHHRDAFIQERIQQRHGDVFYALDLGGVRCISLGEAPDERGLAFLEQNLRTCPEPQPILLFFHLPLLGPWAENNWFTGSGLREKLARILQGHRIAGIFQGHYHASGTYRWNGIDVYEVGSVKHDWRSFFAVHIQGEQMTVASWNLDLNTWWWWHEKNGKTHTEHFGRPSFPRLNAHPRIREWGDPVR